MASSVPPKPSRGYAPATPKGGNRLAIASFVLSLAPVILWALYYVVAGVLFHLLSTNALSTDAFGNVFLLSLLAIYIGSLIVSIGAIVTGGLAWSRAKLYPPQQAWVGLAIAGLMIGIVGTLIQGCVGAGFLLLVHACSGPPGC